MTDHFPPYSDDRPEESDRYHKLQLVAQKGGRYDTIFKGPPGTDIGDLHTEMNAELGVIVVSSGWRPTEDQKAMLEAGAHVRVALWTYPIPPLAVLVEPPVCRCHGDEMVWDPHETGYYCSHAAAHALPDRHVPPSSDSNLEAARRTFTPEAVDGDGEG